MSGWMPGILIGHSPPDSLETGSLTQLQLFWLDWLVVKHPQHPLVLTPHSLEPGTYLSPSSYAQYWGYRHAVKPSFSRAADCANTGPHVSAVSTLACWAISPEHLHLR